MAPVVLAQHVTKWYGPRRAVTDVSFAIEQGEIVGLLGPNGSGKSTIFRMLTGYLVPTSGSIEVAGHVVVSQGGVGRIGASRVCAALRQERRWMRPQRGSIWQR